MVSHCLKMMLIRITKCFVLLFAQNVLLVASVSQHINRNAGLTSFPHGLPSDVGEIDIYGNPINVVDYVDTYMLLETLTISSCNLYNFPDLVNVSTTLEKLYIESNHISTVPSNLLGQLSALKILMIAYNPLTSFPDVSGTLIYYLSAHHAAFSDIPNLTLMSATLQYLYIYNNPEVTEIKEDRFEMIKNLRKLSVYNTGVDTVPNLCSTDLTFMLGLGLSNLVLKCDRNFLWLKLAVVTGHVYLLGDTPLCSPDGGTTVLAWDDIKLSDLTSHPDEKQALYEMTSTADLLCYPGTQTVAGVDGVAKCAQICLSDPLCLMFSVQASNCVIATLSMGDSTVFSGNHEWFMIQ